MELLHGETLRQAMQNVNTGEDFARASPGGQQGPGARCTTPGALRHARCWANAMGSIFRLNAPFGQATTPSLAALRAMRWARWSTRARTTPARLPFHKSAIDPDPDFARVHGRDGAACGAACRWPVCPPRCTEGLARSLAGAGQTAVGRKAYQDFETEWQHAGKGNPLLSAARCDSAAVPH